MNRILFSAMEKKDGKYIYRDNFFSGLGFSIDSEGKVSAFEVREGVVFNSYHSICAPNNEEYMQVDLTGQLSDYVLPQYQGKPYSGIGYEFSDNICDREVFLENGITYSEAHWNENGDLMYFDIPNESFGEICEWYSNGMLKIVKISTKDKFAGAISFAEDGKLNFLSSRGDLLKNLEYISSKAKFFPFKEISDIEKLEITKEFSLFGEDVTSEFLCRIIDAKMLANTTTLRLINTNVKYLNLKKIPLLRKLYINDESVKIIDFEEFKNTFFTQYFELKNIDFHVFINGEELL